MIEIYTLMDVVMTDHKGQEQKTQVKVPLFIHYMESDGGQVSIRYELAGEFTFTPEPGFEAFKPPKWITKP